jgi:GntR family transcriptional regulator, transcriptional repressor for pyruvate dehydrogenase complex
MERSQTPRVIGAKRRPQAFEYVAEQLRREIALGLISPGQALPTERDLARLLHAGRATIQAALALLKEEGLVESRRGRAGGTFVVMTPDAAGVDGQVSEATRQALRPMREALLEGLAFRMEVEPIACSLAALFRTDADLTALRTAAGAAREAKDDATFMLHDSEFHAAIAQASHNRFHADALHRVRTVLEEVLSALPESDLWHARSYREHSRIIAVIAAGNEYEAGRLMREHAGATDVFARALLDVL